MNIKAIDGQFLIVPGLSELQPGQWPLVLAKIVTRFPILNDRLGKRDLARFREPLQLRRQIHSISEIVDIAIQVYRQTRPLMN